MPANVQVYSSKELGRQRQGNLAEFLESNSTSISVNAAQGNPYQLDIAFRGFTASPLVGVPQGLSVFQDGVRINEAFADVVHWDLLPQNAIASMTLLPGSNPVFGLNTLGGALAASTGDDTRWGGVVGVGLEYGFAPNWSAAIEYDHMFMQDRTYTFTTPAGVLFGTDRIRQDVDLVTVRINYRWGGPVVVRY